MWMYRDNKYRYRIEINSKISNGCKKPRTYMFTPKRVLKIKEAIPELKHEEFRENRNLIMCYLTPNELIRCVQAGIFYIDKARIQLVTEKEIYPKSVYYRYYSYEILEIVAFDKKIELFVVEDSSKDYLGHTTSYIYYYFDNL